MVLQIRNPRHCRDRQPPTEEARGFNHNIYMRGAKRRRGAAVQTKRECRSETRLPVEHLRSDDLDARYRIKFREFTLVGPRPGKGDRGELAGQKPIERREQIALIIVAAGPNPSRDVIEREPQWAGRHEACPLNQAT
ncbi:MULTISPECIES: hypothetical protein [unclassified Bradyrhizobium]|uniref:hypothetical protein n=1 Tax=unclassified Bradyrhizobium TaxID=2631580 RepID=UPI002013016F|nr:MULTISPECIES: hypothetical protein [unclassified Bradyrhizobium]